MLEASGGKIPGDEAFCIRASCRSFISVIHLRICISQAPANFTRNNSLGAIINF